MLAALSSGLRFRIAITLAAFAALSFVAPPAVLAFGHGERAAHCLANADAVNHGRAKAPDMTHHADHAPPATNHPMSCCGLFCLSALAAEGGEVVEHVRAREQSLPSRAPERPDRPPISLLPV